MISLANKTVHTPLGNRHIVCRTLSVSLPDFTNARREATRPPKFRGENFDRDFDSTTLFYDAVDIGNQQAVLFAPPFFNLADSLSRTTFFHGSERCATRIRNFDRHAQVRLKTPTQDGKIRASGPLTLRELEMQVIHQALERNKGNKPKAAEELGISLKTLYNKLHQVSGLERSA